ncbi:olfactory receptor 6C75-like [Carettochelys insculpta]|uniref:olfactory receptor 6C75-like n=1 Tax=Carettochelys insculpta TaxID=44489 RepID=UPI003EBB3C29
MEKAGERNQTPKVEFILLGFGNDPELQPLLFLFFLVIYIVTVAGNLLIIVLVVADQYLRTPMYYFLGNLSFLEICNITSILPRLLASLLTGDRTITLNGCIVQLGTFGLVAATESLLLMAMSYDRYLAICHPLRYAALMNGRVCCQLVAGCWLGSFLCGPPVSSFLFHLTFCDSKEIDHFFCDFLPMIKLSCDDTQTLQLTTFTVGGIGLFVSCLLTMASYFSIISTILRIPSTFCRRKAFSTCSSHFTVVTIFFGSMITVYVFPRTNTPKVLHNIFSLFYTVLTPMINPFIYTLRNKEVHESLRRVSLKLTAFRNSHKKFKGQMLTCGKKEMN